MDKECAYLDTLLQLMESYGYIAMFVAMALENANIPIPSEVVLGFAGFLISQQIFSFWTTFAVACIAGVVGSIISYWLGSYGGRPLLLKYGKYIFFNERKFRMAEDLFNKYGGIAVIICRCLPGVRTFIPSAGVALSFLALRHFHHHRYHPLDAAPRMGRLSLGQPLARPRPVQPHLPHAVAALCVVAAVVFVWHKRRRRNVA